MSPRELYDMTGDSEAAMRLMVSENKSGTEETPQQEYNCLLLSALATSTTAASNSDNKKKIKNDGNSSSYNEDDISLLDESLEDARTIVLNSHSKNRNRRAIAEDWILAYNRGLVLLSKGNIEESIRESWSYLKPVIFAKASLEQQQPQQQPPLELVCRMGFLILEGMLTLYPTRSHGRTTEVKETNPMQYDIDSSFDLRLLDTVLAWLRENVELTKAPPQSAGGGNENQQEINATTTTTTSGTPDPQLKFLLSLYESRVNFFERTTGDTTIRDKHMRSARKELKQAMEIFQHKLRPERADTSSLASLSSFSEDVTAAAGGYRIEGKQSPVPSRATSPSPPSGGLSTKSNSQLSRILQGQNQAALNLKANAEQLKGNVKKSLVLCGEAQSYKSETGSSNGNNYYDAIHQNNLGIVYESSGKSHLALHAFSKAVRCAIDNNKSSTISNFDSDGTALPNVKLHVLNNAAVCALKSRNYSAAYQCYAIGLATSKIWRKRPRKWLRLSEACIGLNAMVQKERSETFSRCSKVEVDG